MLIQIVCTLVLLVIIFALVISSVRKDREILSLKLKAGTNEILVIAGLNYFYNVRSLRDKKNRFDNYTINHPAGYKIGLGWREVESKLAEHGYGSKDEI